MDIAKALMHQFPGAEWNLDGNSYEGLVWNDHKHAKPTLQQIEAAWLSYQESGAQKKDIVKDLLNQEAPLSSLIIALWEMVVEKRPESAEAIQKVREQIKSALKD